MTPDETIAPDLLRRLGGPAGWHLALPGMELRLSQAVLALLDLPADSAPDPWSALMRVAPPGRAALRDAIVRCAQDGAPVDLELELRAGAGTLRHVRVVAEAVRRADRAVERIDGALLDVSERHDMQARLQALQQQVNMTYESITEGFYTLDRDYRFAYINGVAERVLGVRRELALGRTVWECFPPVLDSLLQRKYREATATGHTVRFEFFYEPLLAWFDIHAYPSSQGLAVYFQDVTEQLRQKAEILELNTRLADKVRQRTAQLEAVNEELRAFAHSLAHDLRTPIAAVQGFGRALVESLEGESATRQQQLVQRLLAAGGQMSEYVDAMLAMAAISQQRLVLQDVDLSRLAQGILDSLQAAQPLRQARVHVEPGLAARGDLRLLRMAMENLLGNAWKFSGRRAVTDIAFAAHEEAGGRRVYCVRDNGAGFDPRFRDRLFGSFQRLHSADEFAGNGVGLYNVRRIVQRHGGRVWAEGEPEQGASFFFTLGETAPDTDG